MSEIEYKAAIERRTRERASYARMIFDNLDVRNDATSAIGADFDPTRRLTRSWSVLCGALQRHHRQMLPPFVKSDLQSEAIARLPVMIECLLNRDLRELQRVLRNLLLLIWLLLERTYLRWRARLSGIDPDTIPEIQDLRRRKERQRKSEDQPDA